MQVYQLRDYLDHDMFQDLLDSVSDINWNYGAPGGFVTNHPNRRVNAFGNGGRITDDGSPQQEGWATTHWTAKMSQNNATLSTNTEPIPAALCAIIPTLRLLFQSTFSDVKITDNTFNIAVCNNYTDPGMTIADHTDDNQWYPHECAAGPVFASLTLYPDGEPTTDAGYARFQIRPGDRWEDVRLPHASLMIMPSGIRHRVLATRKSDVHLFRPRINITFRSTYPVEVNPLLNAMATANHARYYRVPSTLHYPDDIATETLEQLRRAYETFITQHSNDTLSLNICQGGSKGRTERRRGVVSKYRQLSEHHNWGKVRLGANLVTELLDMVCEQYAS